MDKVLDITIIEKERIGMFSVALSLMWLEMAYNQGLGEDEVRDRVLNTIFESI